MAKDDLYGKTSATIVDEGDYESPKQYDDQGDTRVVKNHGFRYLAKQGEDGAGNPVLTPVSINRGETVTVDQIGRLALKQGEETGAFYTKDELEGKTGASAPASGSDIGSAGEFELVEYLQTGNDGKPPTINDVLEAVGDDKDLANRMLAAENIASDGDPRSGLEQGLTKVIES
jgi:hypothetical protein